MTDHSWLGGVLVDLAQYCRKNQMPESLAAIKNAQVIYAIELSQVEGPLQSDRTLSQGGTSTLAQQHKRV